MLHRPKSIYSYIYIKLYIWNRGNESKKCLYYMLEDKMNYEMLVSTIRTFRTFVDNVSEC